MKKFGIAAMVDAAVWLDKVAGREILGIGRAAFDRADCTLEAAGRQLLMKVSLQGGWIWLSACGLDECEPPQPDLQPARHPGGVGNRAQVSAGLRKLRRYIVAPAPD